MKGKKLKHTINVKNENASLNRCIGASESNQIDNHSLLCYSVLSYIALYTLFISMIRLYTCATLLTTIQEFTATANLNITL